MDNIIQASNICKRFTNHVALDDVSISIPRGKVYGLLGPNGAGKTTMIRIINHITAPDSGRVVFDGHELTAADVTSIGYLPDERGLYKKMRVGEQAMFFARLKGLSKADAARSLREWFERFEIMDWWNRKVEELSKGMAQKVQFIVTVLHRPKLLIFDEPFSGFDPINANLLKNEILRLRDEGATVVFSTHNMESVEELCENITLINRSHNILSGNVAEIRERMGKGCYRLTFEGSAEQLRTALQPMLHEARFALDGQPDCHGVVSGEFSLAEGATLRDFLSTANEAVDIMSFDRALPSMNEIFIRTVGEANVALGETEPTL